MNTYLSEGISAIKAGDRETARRQLAQALREDPNNERAWQWMFNAANNDTEREKCLNEILRINPGNEKARQALQKIQEMPDALNQIFASDQVMKKCPHCAEQIRAEAEVCRYCGKSVNPTVIKAEKVAGIGKVLEKIGCMMFIIGIGGLCLLWLLL